MHICVRKLPGACQANALPGAEGRATSTTAQPSHNHAHNQAHIKPGRAKQCKQRESALATRSSRRILPRDVRACPELEPSGPLNGHPSMARAAANSTHSIALAVRAAAARHCVAKSLRTFARAACAHNLYAQPLLHSPGVCGRNVLQYDAIGCIK